MKDTNFTITIHDFLSMNTLQDTVNFSNKFSTSLPHIPEGVSCNIHIQAGDEKTFLLTISGLNYVVRPTCDVCASQMEERIQHEDTFFKFFGGCDEELLKDNEISFPLGQGYVDLEPLFVQEITLKENIKHVCKDCGEKTSTSFDETSEGNGVVRIT